MKLPHWVQLLLGALVVGLTSLEGQLPPAWALAVRLVVVVAGALTTGVGIASKSALTPAPLDVLVVEGKKE
jgi:hypothetical protein